MLLEQGQALLTFGSQPHLGATGKYFLLPYPIPVFRSNVPFHDLSQSSLLRKMQGPYWLVSAAAQAVSRPFASWKLV
jgi:hypothetical protein